MRIKNKSKAVISLLRVKLLNKRIPLAVRWQLTNRCVSQCKYCNIGNTAQKELSFSQILTVLDQLAEFGTQTISFSGGEPMLRKDIGKILEETKKRKISTEMNSTGARIPQQIAELKHLDFLKISLDGSEEIHDLIRGKGSYKMAIEAAGVAKNNNLNFIFTTTLTKQNIKQIEFLIKIAEEYHTLVAFQPLKSLYRGVEDISEIGPSENEFKQAIDKLIEFKKKGNPHLRNSLIGLYHIYNWPKYRTVRCWAGRLFCIIETNGTLLPCDRIFYNATLPNCTETSFRDAFLSLPDVRCNGCGFCGALELNFLMAFKPGSIKSIFSITK